MSVAEMKKEVINKINNLEDEDLLKNLLDFLNSGVSSTSGKLSLSSNYDIIKQQYNDVLQKLAE